MHIHIYEPPFSVPLYGLLFFIGIAVAAGIAALICKRRSIDRYDIVCSAVYTMIGAAIGAKLLFIAISLDDALAFAEANNLSFSDTMMSIIKGGFVFYGGFIGGFLGLLIYCKQFKMKLMPFIDIYAVVVPLGHAFGRIGCLFGGCCYGMEYDGPLAVEYHYSLSATTPLNTPLLPTQLIEAVSLTLIFALLITLYLKGAKQGVAPVVYLFSYSVLRFILEFFRMDSERGSFLGVTTSQWIALGIAIITIISVIIYRKRKQKDLTTTPETTNI